MKHIRSEAVEKPGGDTVDGGALVKALWRCKWIVILSSLALAGLSYALVSRTTPEYTARASVMLDPRSVRVVSSDEVLSDLTLNNPALNTEAAVMRTNVLLGEVIDSFEPGELAPIDPAEAPDDAMQGLKDWLRALIDRVSGGDASTDPAVEPPAAPVLSVEELYMRRLLGGLRRAMTVWREPESYIISVAITTSDPALSMRIANRILEIYVSRQVARRSAIVRDATTFLDSRVAEMERGVEEAEIAVENFRRAELDRSGVSLETLERQLLELSAQLALARADLASARSRAQQIQSVIDTDGFETAAELLSSPLVISMRDDLFQLQREDANFSTELGPEHPERQRVRRAMDLINDDLANEVRKIVAGLKNEETIARIRAESLQESLSETESRVSELSRSSLELRQLEREASAVRANYEAMLERLNETRTIEDLQRADARIVEVAQMPGAPSAPRVKLFTVLGGTAGFAIGLMIAFFLAISSRGFQRSSEIEADTGLPVVVSLPAERWKSLRAMLQSLSRMPYQVFAERIRLLRSSGMLAKPDGRGAVVMITSAVAREGKSVASVAIASVEAMAKRRCLVLDFDLRRSRLAKGLGYSPPGGDLSSYLRGECALEEAIYSVPGAGFDLLSLYRPAPQLIDEVAPERIEAMVSALAERYDLVLIDTPPVLAVSEALTMARRADTVLLLARQRTTRRHAVHEAARSLDEAGAARVGIVMTVVDAVAERDAYGVASNYAYASR